VARYPTPTVRQPSSEIRQINARVNIQSANTSEKLMTRSSILKKRKKRRESIPKLENSGT
jgi:hypothetical protein